MSLSLLVPRELSKDQRIVLKNLIERATDHGDLRGAAIFALGYFAGCRVSDVSHLLVRNDFAHRAKQAGLEDGELAVYLGHITKRGTPAIQTTARYTQPSMDHVREKLIKMKG
jgi:hypothetical protein